MNRNDRWAAWHEAHAAGFLWSSLADLLRFADLHIAAAHDVGGALNRDSSARLLTPTDGQTFAAGWEVETTRRADGIGIERSVYHGGYSGRFRGKPLVLTRVPDRHGDRVQRRRGGGDRCLRGRVLRAPA